MDIHFKPIGIIRTPYTDKPPHQPEPDAEGAFYIELDPEFERGLYLLETFSYIYVLFYLDRAKNKATLKARPPKAGGKEVGVFASRSPRRPNPIGLSAVRLREIQGTRLIISGIDALDKTPVLDIKPYVRRLDIKPEANDGWRSD